MRKLNWSRALIEKAIEMVGKEYVIGETDCANLAMTVLQSMYSEPMFASVTIATETDVARSMLEFQDVILSTGAVEIPVNYATCGDLLLSHDTHGDERVIGISVLTRNRVLSSHPETGVTMSPYVRASYFAAYRFPNGQ